MRTRCIVWAAALALCVAPAIAPAQVVFDDSLGPAGAAPTRINLPGFDLDHLITYDEQLPVASRHGVRSGGNLFQSLTELSILQPAGTRTSATFQAFDAGGNPLPLNAVIARVTGSNPSRIQGVLRSEVPGADIFLLNPNGVFFEGTGGLENQLDVPAAVHISTADFLRFADDAIFPVAPITPASLSVESPAAFGFSGGTAGAITLDGSLPLGPIGGQTFSLVAGGVILINESIARAQGGVLQVAAVGAATVEVPIDLATWNAAGFAPGTLGTISLSQDTEFRTSDISIAPQGRIVLRGGELIVDDSSISAGGNGGAASVALDVEMSDRIIVRNDSRLQAGGNPMVGVGSGRLVTPRLEVSDLGTRVGIRVAGVGTATGDFHVIADEILVTDQGVLTTENRQSAPGGNLILDSNVIEVRDGGAIEALAASGTGAGGSLQITTGELLVTRTPGASAAGLVQSNSVNGGPAGDVVIDAIHVAVENGGLIVAQAGIGSPGGNISITTDSLRLQGGSQIRASTDGDQNAGNVSVDATGDLTIIGDGPNPAEPSGIFARSLDPLGSGNAGELTVAARSLLLTGNAFVSTRGIGNGAAGTITIDIEDLMRVEGSGQGTPEIASRTIDGAGGRLVVDAGTLELIDGGAIATSTLGAGDAGDITVTAGSVLLSGIDGFGNESAILSETTSPDIDAGLGGTIDIDSSGDVEIENGGLVSARSQGPGNAGSIAIRSGRDVFVESGEIVTEAPGSEGGNILIDARREVQIVTGAVTTSVLGRAGVGGAGNVGITADTVVVNASEVLAQAVLGDGGNILIQANAYLQSADSFVDASSEAGIDGQVDAPPPDATLRRGLAVLPSNFVDRANLLREHCAARSGDQGSFIIKGRDGAGESPARPLPTRMPFPPTSEGAASNPQAQAPPTGSQLSFDCAALRIDAKRARGRAP